MGNDLDIEERVQHGLEILEMSSDLERIYPSYFKKIEEKLEKEKKKLKKGQSLSTQYQALEKLLIAETPSAIKQKSAYYLALSKFTNDPSSVNDSYSGSNNFIFFDIQDAVNDASTRITKNMKSAVTKNKKFSKYSKLVNTNDFQGRLFKGKGTYLTVGDTEYHFHDFDAVYAAKKGGYLNKVYYEIFEVYNRFTEEMFSTVKDNQVENDKAKSSVYEGIIKNIALEKSTIKRTEFVSEANDEDLLEIINLCVDVINLNKDRKLVTKNIKTQIQAV